MKPSFNILLFLLLAFALSHFSCTDDDVAPDPAAELVKIAEGFASGSGLKIGLYAEEELFAGYNPVFLAIYDSADGKRITSATAQLHPLMTMSAMSHSCPVEDPGSTAVSGLFPGAILFTMPSGEAGSWTLEINVVNNDTGSNGTVLFNLNVLATTPSKVTSLSTDDGHRYYLAYQFKDKPKVGPNTFEVIAFARDGSSFVPAEDLGMIMTPEMPSMDHGSPNNENPVHTTGGHYSGTVNFTMTGEWRINLELAAGSHALGTRYFDVVIP